MNKATKNGLSKKQNNCLSNVEASDGAHCTLYSLLNV